MENTRIRLIIIIIILLLVAAGIAGLIYWRITSARVYVDKAVISAPLINLPAKTGGILEEVFAKEGDIISDNAPVARVGNELIKAQNSGLILTLSSEIGANFSPGQTVATMIVPTKLRVVGQVAEDKGLKDIRIGQTAIFTVDAFGSKQYTGTVDEISPTANQGDIVFNISNARQENNFDVKIRFDITQYPELKNGMSAKLWIYK
jgi:multidrug resistance efflux pump